MPFERPAVTFGGRTWWSVVEQTEHFVLQAHRMPSIWPQNPYRILVEGNASQIASAKDKDSAMADWKEAMAMCQQEPLKSILAKFITKDEMGKLISDVFDKQHQHRVDAVKAQEAAKLAELQRLKELEVARNLEALRNASVVVSPSPVFGVESTLRASDVAALAPSLLISSSPSRESALSLGSLVDMSDSTGGGSSVMLKDVNGTKTVVEKLPLEGTFCSDETRLEGWLSKQAKLTGVSVMTLANPNGSWKRRYFVLKRGCLWYYQMTSKPAVRIDADYSVSVPATAHVESIDHRRFGYFFTLISGGVQTLFSVPTQTDLNSWLSALNAIRSQTDDKSWLERRGFMFMQAKGEKEWKYRYFILHRRVLDVFEATEKGFLPLLDGTVEVNAQKPCTFTIRSALKGVSSVLHLQASEADVMETWLDALTHEIEQLRLEEQKHGGEAGVSRLKRILEAADSKALLLLNRVRDVLLKEHVKPRTQAPFTRPKKLNVICFDGGGLRGVMGTIILERIIAEFPDFLSKIDLIGGCSNGSMIAMSLGFGLSASACRTILEVTGEIVLTKGGLASGYNSAKFTNHYLKLMCDEVWGVNKIKDAHKLVLIPAFLLDNHNGDKAKRIWQNKWFHNLSADPDNDPAALEFASDVVLRSSSAPSYFPSYQKYVDGGMFAHDTSSYALTLAMSRLKYRPEDISLFSIGTGFVPNKVEGDTHDWGMVQWLPYVANILWDGMVQKSESICTELLEDRYHRLNPLLEKELPMDDPGAVPVLTKTAYQVDLTRTLQWIRKNYYSDEATSSHPTVPPSPAPPLHSPAPIPAAAATPK